MKKKLLVLASTFPRWKNDTLPPFVYEISRRLTGNFDVSVLAPSYPGAKDYEVMDGMDIYRYHYFIKKFEKLAGSGGILQVLKSNFFYYIEVPFFMLFGYFALKKLVKKISPDIIHAHWIIPQGILAALIKKKYDVPFMVTAHGADVSGMKGKISVALKKFVLFNAKVTTAVSNTLKNEIITSLAPLKPVRTISMGVDTALFNPDKKSSSLKKTFNLNGPVIIFVGRLAHKKGLKYLIEAMPTIIEKFPTLKLLIIGNGQQEKELKEKAINLKISDNVNFVGAVNNADLPSYYATADVFVGPSIVTESGDTEGLPVTFLEAMASGCIVIGTDAGGIPELIKNGETGFSVKQKDSLEISRVVIGVLSNLYKYDEIRANAREFIVNNFDWKIISKKYCEELL